MDDEYRPFTVDQSNDREIVLSSVRACGANLRYASDTLCGDEEVVLAALGAPLAFTKYTFALASQELRESPIFLAKALKVCFHVWRHLPVALRNDRQYVLEVVHGAIAHPPLSPSSGDGFENLHLMGERMRIEEFTPFWSATERFHADRDFMLAAVRMHPMSFRFAALFLQDDSEVAMAAVQAYGLSIEYASARIRESRWDMALAAVSNDSEALRYLPAVMQSDREIVLKSVEKKGRCLLFASNSLKADQALVEKAIQNDCGAFEFAAPELKADRDLVLNAVRGRGVCLEFAASHLQADYEVVTLAIQNDGEALEFAAPELQMDPDIVSMAFSTTDNYINHDIESGCVDFENGQEHPWEHAMNFRGGAMKKRWDSQFGQLQKDLKELGLDGFDFSTLDYPDEPHGNFDACSRYLAASHRTEWTIAQIADTQQLPELAQDVITLFDGLDKVREVSVRLRKWGRLLDVSQYYMNTFWKEQYEIAAPRDRTWFSAVVMEPWSASSDSDEIDHAS